MSEVRRPLAVQDDDDSDNQNQKKCWVCHETEEESSRDDVVWLNPCQCKGTMKWVHEHCLQTWIDRKQETTNTNRVTCSQCKSYYIMCFPKVNYLVRLIEQYDRLLYGSSPFVAVSVVVGSIYWCCGSFGFISIIQVMGWEEGNSLIQELDPALLIIGLPVIPIALILAKLIKWEDCILRLWKQRAFQLPRPLSILIESPPAQPRANCEQILRDPGFNEPLGCTRMVCGALLLPSISALIGKIFFSSFSQHQWRRSLMGGLAFLLFKGAMKIYLRKSQYVRYSQRTIINYDSNKVQPDGSADIPGPNPVPSNSSELDEEDPNYDGQRPRTRTYISMTIRI